MYLFKRIKYSIDNDRIEGYNNSGQATTMKGLLSYPKEYAEVMNFMWATATDIERYLHSEGNGKFSAMVPKSYFWILWKL